MPRFRRHRDAIAAAARDGDCHGAPTEPARLKALLALRSRVQTASSLPIGLGVLGRGLIYLALPVATWGATELRQFAGGFGLPA